ncbi:MAG: choice-of-anchor L domain-containing protein, partial [Patiriisocius sp.]|uniref:choice-of-anchor L domain-containing protein n=1 Tax=Patiriisocius sp. TaxID=2822396 RepID=UPI003EF7009D
MIKHILFISLFFTSFLGLSQITVDETLTTQELVEDILINSPCADVSNFIQSTGSDFGDVNGIAAFNGNGSTFPFTNGVVLSTGAASSAPGPNTDLNSEGNSGIWPGDGDLETNTTATNTNNASFIQFDFVPQIDQISFNFIFVSEEYNENFECTFSDAFAFILTDQITGAVQNLAVLPGTAIPIEVTNVHPEVSPTGTTICNAINEQYFEQYNFVTSNPNVPNVDENLAPIDFNGQTISLVAQGNVVVGNTYTIKLVIADEQDDQYDAAVFLEGGSFNIGIDLGDDLTIANDNAGCEGGSTTVGLVSGGTGSSTYQWYRFNPITMVYDIIPGATDSTLVVTQSGTYRLEVFVSGGCSETDEIFVEFAPPPILNTPSLYDICDDLPNDGFATFDLTTKDLEITGPGGEPVSYYTSFAGAQAGFFPIPTPTAFVNTVLGFQIIYARVDNPSATNCFSIVPLELQVNDSPSITSPISDYFLCDLDGDGLETFDLTSKEGEIL